jgi:hypothetical protein
MSQQKNEKREAQVYDLPAGFGKDWCPICGTQLLAVYGDADACIGCAAEKYVHQVERDGYVPATRVA